MLDNPIWHSLSTRHAHLALCHGVAKRYPPLVTPFVGVSEPTEAAARDVEALVAPGERVGILNVIPPLPWTVVKEIRIHQYVWLEELSTELDAETVPLSAEHLPAMLELTALVYPAYFRSETASLGDYFGFFRDGRLAAMSGIRMAMDGYQEISAICTHPDFRGQGLGGRLTRHLVSRIQDDGEVAFLHTESDNPANALYTKLGFELRKVLPFVVFERQS